METLGSVLTLSPDFGYGELVRENYAARSVETFYLPFFDEADTFVKVMLPDAIIFDIQPSDFSECSSFLKQLLAFQKENLGYVPSIFVSRPTSMLLRQLSTIQREAAALTANAIKREKSITLEQFQLEDLVEILDSNQTQRNRSALALENIATTIHPFDSITPALSC